MYSSKLDLKDFLNFKTLAIPALCVSTVGWMCYRQNVAVECTIDDLNTAGEKYVGRLVHLKGYLVPEKSWESKQVY